MTLRRWGTTTGVAVVLIVGAALGALTVARESAAARDDGVKAAAEIEAERIVATIERDLVEMERIALLATGAPAFRRAAGARLTGIAAVSTIALADRDGDRVIVRTAVPSDAGPLTTGEDLTAAETFDVVLERVLGDADAAAGAPYEIDGRGFITVAAPVFERPAAASEAERRTSVIAAVVGAIDVEGLLAGWDGAAELQAPIGEPVGRAATGSALEQVINIRNRPWTIRLDSPAPGWPPTAWAVLGAGILVALAITVALDRERERRRAAEAQAATRSLQLERIAEAGARLQQSLDLGELLPSFAVALAADFDLQAVSIALLDGDGLLTESFATGERSAAAPTERSASIDLPLRRGWRAVGVLTVRPGRPLDGAELTSLQALADLLAVAMSNAQLYEREQLNAARLRDLDALKNAFLGTVSHELRTSMTAIMGFGELLSDAWDNLDDERRREMANRIRRSAGSLRHLVDDLLDFARLEQERLRVSPRAIDLAGVVRVTIEGLTPLLNHHELDLQVPADQPAWADPVAVERILANLVSNAAKYSPRDSKVTISVSAAGDRARLVVADEGPGIPPDERRRIFARFYRLDTPESVRTRGAGIGLAILHDFAERSGATVRVDDAPGGGAQFTVDFPTTADDIELAEAQ